MFPCTPTPIVGHTARGTVFEFSFLPWMLATTADICDSKGVSSAGLLQSWRLK